MIIIKDLTVPERIDIRAPHGGSLRFADGGRSIEISAEPCSAYINDVLMSAAEQGPYALISTRI